MNLREKIGKILLVSVVFGAISFAIIIANDIEPDTEPKLPLKKKAPNNQKTTALLQSTPTQKKKALEKNETELLAQIIEFSTKVPKELSVRIAKVTLQSRPTNSQLEETLSNIANTDELSHLISENGDLVFNIEVLTESKNRIFLGSLEDIKTKNRVFELSWQKKTR